jgi:hypothetical protein
MATNPAPVAPVGPSAPNLTTKNLWQQFWTDAYGKEVQTAATYSYTWLADQFGHICIGIVVGFITTAVPGLTIRAVRGLFPGASLPVILGTALASGWMIIVLWEWNAYRSSVKNATGTFPLDTKLLRDNAVIATVYMGLGATLFGALALGVYMGLVATLGVAFGALAWGWGFAVGGAALWEWSAYRSAVKNAKGSFPLDTKLLCDNARIATVYMALGAVLGFAFHRRAIPALLISCGVVVAAILLAPRWLRQKITWQKAALPYLFRLADAAPTIGAEDAKTLQSLIDGGAPPAKHVLPCQVVIGGPIGSGRTSMAAGIGTEFAFKNNKVRYLSLDTLLEFAASASDDPGPTTIMYWPWSEAQVVIIDGVGPLIAAQEPQQKANLARFTQLLHHDLKPIARVLAQCHTVWVIGDLCPPNESGTLGATLDDFAKAIATYCSCQRDTLVIELGEPVKRSALKGEPRAAAVRNVRRIDTKKNP